ncbi:DUF1996 domain-containing protein [Amycolatopsis acidiphila]|uniref:DUF1996 domain-containing protein n=1 Tax=Amycolatopsis acidiphila TaxID=715473 RepID=A0A558AFA3_9PSEU|nr:DUF1996 domain-containing protein [Amycolatopsis acidiphila]TVT22947.1 DUF1996 domain-containing protein [Amycolatopsis acidiphila]UIJ57108.1 DUF1996 domain-containing protein [Amycolatopsis acidiphila]
MNRTTSWIVATVVVLLAAVLMSVAGYRLLTPAAPGEHGVADFVAEEDLSPAAAMPPAGSWRIDCGRNTGGMHNADNLVASPGRSGGAHHVHDYVGNLSTNAFSTDASLAAAATTCPDGDRSSYYWPVLRLPATDRILVPGAVSIEYQGSPAGDVVPMPEFLPASTGNAHDFSSGGKRTEHVQWGCSGAPGRVARQYPRCAAGERVLRLFDFPSCWNGRTTDSADHRSQLVFPGAAGACPIGTFPVPRLHSNWLTGSRPGRITPSAPFPKSWARRSPTTPTT